MIQINKYFELPALILIILSMSACEGGGGSGSGSDKSSAIYEVVSSATPSSAGTVSGGGSYANGESVTLTANANDGFSFKNWTEDGIEVSTSTGYTFIATDDRTLMAQFDVNSYTIDVVAGPVERGFVTGNGSYNHGASVTVTATPNDGFTFVNWTENGTEVSTNSSYTFNAANNRSLVANFDIKGYRIETIVSSQAGGSILGSGTYAHGITVILTATANTGYSFVNWTEGGQEVAATSDYSFTATSDRSLVANFSINSYSISASSSTVSGGKVTGSGVYNYGSSITLNATAFAGYTFKDWTEDGAIISTSESYTIDVLSAHTLVANFVSDVELLNGLYYGVMKSPLALFVADQTYTTIEVSGTDISITQEHILGETCIFTGQLTDHRLPASASGTYQCSDFTTGTWSSSAIAKTADDAFIAELNVDTGNGSYIARYNGFMSDSNVPYYYKSISGYLYNTGNYMDVAGTYTGALKSSDSCASFSFEVSSSGTTVTITDSNIEINRDAFFEGVCIYTGTIANVAALPLSASGTYQCSNFETGTWSSDNITLTGTDSFYAKLNVDVPSRGCSYDVSYSGFK